MERSGFQRFLRENSFIIGPLSLAALATGIFRKVVLLASWSDPWVIVPLVAGVLLGAGFILGNPTQVRTTLTKRGTRYGFNAAVMSLAFIAILVFLNYLAERYDFSHDFTETKIHTLSPQSKLVVAELDRPITIIGFFGADTYSQQESFEELLDQYLREDKNNYLSYRTIDPDRQPLEARAYEEPYQGLLVQSGDRIERVLSAREQDITGALLKVTSEKPKVIYFLTGHGERDPESVADDGYSTVAERLRSQNYEVKSLSLAVTQTVPSDASLIVIAGPKGKYLDDELVRLQSYLAGGGRALILQDPFLETGLNVILANWGVSFGEGYVVDPVRHLPQYPTVPAPAVYSNISPVTRDFREITFFPFVRPIEQSAPAAEDITYTSLAETTEQSWVEIYEQIARDPSDQPGPLTLAASIEKSSSNTRIVLVGTTEFAANWVTSKVEPNTQLFLNAVNWLAEEERLIAIGPKDAMRQPVSFTEVTERLIFFFSLIVVPVSILSAGLVVWAVRRVGVRAWSRSQLRRTEQ